MRLLVTGGAGFIGSNFIRYWLNRYPNDEITNLDALTYAGNLHNLDGVDQSRHHFIHGNICDPKAVQQAMEGVDTVVHFAAESHVDRSIDASQVFLQTNILGTHTLLEEARRRGDQIKRFHHVSTDEVYGSLELDDPNLFHEQSPYHPRSPYSAAKAGSDHLCRAYGYTHNLPVTISHCSNNYGPYHFPEKFIPLMIVQALRDLPLPIYGDGLNVRDWIHVEDHCRGIEAVLMRGRVGHTYCFGGEAERANIDVAKIILDHLRKPQQLLRFVEDRKGHDRRYALASHKAKQELGWQPTRSFEAGLRQTIDWYVEHQDWWRPLLTEPSQNPVKHDKTGGMSPMKILIFGKGFIGTRMAEAWPEAAISTARIDDKAAVLKDLEDFKPDVVINTAGRTGSPNVDWCETHQMETARSNVTGVLTLAEACQERGVYLLHLSSGCIFYGPSPDPRGWTEDDFANPISFYSRSKYAADLLLSRMPNVGIARLRMPIDHFPSSRNLIDKLSRYPKIIDVENSVTVVDDLIQASRQLLEKRAEGVFHVVNPGTMKHRDLIALYREYVDPNHSCEWISNDDLVKQGLAVKQRSNCVLQSNRLAELGIYMRPVHLALRETMKQYAAHTKETAAPAAFAFQKSRTREMKGVITAGGTGSRLAPLTHHTNKHLLPIYNQPMILYPLNTLLAAGVRDIMLITGPDYAHQFMKLFGSGSKYNCKLTYRIQEQAGGIAQCIGLAENFVGDNNCSVILGDNIFEDNLMPHISSFQEGAMTFYRPVDNPSEYGVIEIDAQGRVLSIEEKPKQPKSNLAQVGLYVYDPDVFSVIRSLKPSTRGELEIVDVNNHYLQQNKLVAKPIRSIWWDVGTFTGMMQATQYFSKKSGS